MNTNHTCCWILSYNEPGNDKIYCGNPVSYKIVKDDDDNNVRKYNHFCTEHKKLADVQDDADNNEAEGTNQDTST